MAHHDQRLFRQEAERAQILKWTPSLRDFWVAHPLICACRLCITPTLQHCVDFPPSSAEKASFLKGRKTRALNVRQLCINFNPWNKCLLHTFPWSPKLGALFFTKSWASKKGVCLVDLLGHVDWEFFQTFLRSWKRFFPRSSTGFYLVPCWLTYRYMVWTMEFMSRQCSNGVRSRWGSRRAERGGAMTATWNASEFEANAQFAWTSRVRLKHGYVRKHLN